MAKEARYVDADELMRMVYSSNPYLSSNYSSSEIERSIDAKIAQTIQNAFSSFTSNLAMAIDKAAKPYSQCMLCTRKDHDPNPYDLNR